MPTPGQVIDSLDLLQMFAEAEEDAEDVLDALRTNETLVRRLITKRIGRKDHRLLG